MSITNSDNEKIFTGNSNDSTVNRENFFNTVELNLLRIYLQTCDSEGCALRFELYGQNECDKPLDTTTISSVTLDATDFSSLTTSQATLGATTKSSLTTTSQVPEMTTDVLPDQTNIINRSTVSDDHVTASESDIHVTKTSQVASTKYAITPVVPSTGSSIAIIAGGAAGALIVIILVICIAAICWRKRSRKPRTESRQVLQFDGTYELTVNGVDYPTPLNQQVTYENTSNDALSGHVNQGNGHIYNDVEDGDRLPQDTNNCTYENRLSNNGIYSQDVTQMYVTEDHLQEHQSHENRDVKTPLYAEVQKKDAIGGPKRAIRQSPNDNSKDMYAQVMKKTPKTKANVRSDLGEEGWVDNSIYNT
ncbi:uncharacterized protein [Amphiura filiformis]|uniref:uncharacterized protein n=1 Tax=Amphiura filiformis TaxID=82378 RepID=UPI003B212678